MRRIIPLFVPCFNGLKWCYFILREELVEEKIKGDNLSSSLDAINNKLKKVGIDKNILEGEAEFISNE